MIDRQPDTALDVKKIIAIRIHFEGRRSEPYTAKELVEHYTDIIRLCDMAHAFAASSPSAPSRDAVLEEAAKIRTVPRIGPLAGAAWLAYKEGQADYAAAILQHKNAAPQVPPKATRGRGERPVQFSRKR